MRSVQVVNGHAAAHAARHAFRRLTGREPDGIAFAPGRVNLIGEHTDYNDGFVLPMAIEEGIAAAFRRRDDEILRVCASDIGQTRQVAIGALDASGAGVTGWFRYAAGVAWAMRQAGHSLNGVDVAVAANLPSGAGLSSSAALELAIARALSAVADIPWDARAAALMAQQAEHAFAHVACGIMDQMAVACAHEGAALLLDCRSLAVQDVALPPAVRIVVMNSGVRRTLVTSEYNERRASCERAVAAIQTIDPAVGALRDVSPVLLEQARPLMDETTYRRAAHVIAENGRPALLADALTSGDLDAAGLAMADSHASLRDLYEVSSIELDALVGAASSHDACYGARLTGAGFGGCAIALVDAGDVGPFAGHVAGAYAAATGLTATITASRATAGARLL